MVLATGSGMSRLRVIQGVADESGEQGAVHVPHRMAQRLVAEQVLAMERRVKAWSAGPGASDRTEASLVTSLQNRGHGTGRALPDRGSIR